MVSTVSRGETVMMQQTSRLHFSRQFSFALTKGQRSYHHATPIAQCAVPKASEELKGHKIKKGDVVDKLYKSIPKHGPVINITVNWANVHKAKESQKLEKEGLMA
jgi:hypothetical protein